MSSKNAKNGDAAKKGAADGFDDKSAPDAKPDPVLPCKQNHWVGYRVVNDLGKPVAGVKVKITYPDKTTADTVSDKKGQFKSAKTLGEGECEFSFPDLYDAEWKSQ